MTLSFSQAKVIYQGNGQTTQWDIPFAFLDKSHLTLTRIDPGEQSRVLEADFVIDLEKNAVLYPMPGSQTPPLPAGSRLMIARHTPLTQQADFEAQQSFDPSVLEKAYDKAIMIAQEQAEKLARAVAFPPYQEVSSADAAEYLNTLQNALQQAQQTQGLSAQALEQARQAFAQAEQAVQDAQAAVGTLQGYVQQAGQAQTQARAFAETAQKWAVQTTQEVEAGEGYGAKKYADTAALAAQTATQAQAQAEQTAQQVQQSAASVAGAEADCTAAAAEAAQSVQQALQAQQSAAQSAQQAQQAAQAAEAAADLTQNTAAKDLSNVTQIHTASAVYTALSGKAEADLSNGTKAAQADINRIMPDEMDYVVERYADSEGNWYRVYKSGWVEQGGYSTATTTVTLLKPMADTQYTVLSVQRGTAAPDTQEGSPRAGVVSTSQIFVVGGGPTVSVCFYVCGQGAE